MSYILCTEKELRYLFTFSCIAIKKLWKLHKKTKEYKPVVDNNWPGEGQGRGRSLLTTCLFMPHDSFKVSDHVIVFTYQKIKQV